MKWLPNNYNNKKFNTVVRTIKQLTKIRILTRINAFCASQTFPVCWNSRDIFLLFLEHFEAALFDTIWNCYFSYIILRFCYRPHGFKNINYFWRVLFHVPKKLQLPVIGFKIVCDSLVKWLQLIRTDHNISKVRNVLVSLQLSMSSKIFSFSLLMSVSLVPNVCIHVICKFLKNFNDVVPLKELTLPATLLILIYCYQNYITNTTELLLIES